MTAKLAVCGGFDGSSVDDWTAIRLETYDGWQFTPTYSIGGERFPCYWNPANHGGKIPRGHVDAAVEQLFERFAVERLYCDPRDWQTEVDTWALEHGDEHVVEWEMGRGSQRIRQVHDALERFVTDLTTGALTHDGCEQTALHVANARKVPKPGDRYILAKPAGAHHQKIDLAVTSMLAHEAACDARADGWTGEPADTRVIVFR